MSKMSIEWHEQCLRNQNTHLTHEEQVLQQQAERVARLRREFFSYEDQIAEAKRRGMDGFDRERLLVKRERKTA